jgi:hypothetical protein
MSVGKTWVSPADFAGCDAVFDSGQSDTQRMVQPGAGSETWEVSAERMSDWAMILVFVIVMAIPFALVAWLLA